MRIGVTLFLKRLAIVGGLAAPLLLAFSAPASADKWGVYLNSDGGFALSYRDRDTAVRFKSYGYGHGYHGRGFHGHGYHHYDRHGYKRGYKRGYRHGYKHGAHHGYKSDYWRHGHKPYAHKPYSHKPYSHKPHIHGKPYGHPGHGYKPKAHYGDRHYHRHHRPPQRACHAFTKKGVWKGHPAKVGGTRCYDDYGKPYVVKGSRHLIHYY